MDKNKTLFEASQSIPGGVNSPVRAFSAVGGTPIFFKKGLGSYIWDENDKKYVDYINSWGPMILGHANEAVILAVQEASKNSLSFGAPTSRELHMAEALVKLIPSMEQVRLVSSGTEATMSAIRVARGFTSRDRIIKFEGCYHGHADALLVKAGSGALTFGQPSSAGVPRDVAKHTHTLPFNDTKALKNCFKDIGSEIACVIIEPIVGNMNLILPDINFLRSLRSLCTALLIFDEVMTGFRAAPGGAQELWNISPDITCLGKVIGGGLANGRFWWKEKYYAAISSNRPCLPSRYFIWKSCSSSSWTENVRANPKAKFL